MEPKFKKTRRKGDLRQPWEYQGWLIHSSKSGMYNMVNWSANKDWLIHSSTYNWFANKDDHRTIVASSLKDLCVKIDQAMEAA